MLASVSLITLVPFVRPKTRAHFAKNFPSNSWFARPRPILSRDSSTAKAGDVAWRWQRTTSSLWLRGHLLNRHTLIQQGKALFDIMQEGERRPGTLPPPPSRRSPLKEITPAFEGSVHVSTYSCTSRTKTRQSQMAFMKNTEAEFSSRARAERNSTRFLGLGSGQRGRRQRRRRRPRWSH